ncbi:barstar family protein [Flexivirga sp. ID2601S]|uniref:Barstar family protein n=1 Tax=Flexivirga aerilata TaxID=1656889 RepID=A0A849AKP9_9MICO|nr:barstar family protein [Flexivirga aerilata]
MQSLIESASSGIHRTSDAAAAERLARENDWRIVELDTRDAHDKAAFLAVCRSAFDLPDWFGDNWDALEDSLTDVDATPGVLVLWRGAASLDEATREVATDILAERGRRTERGLSPFLVLVVR